MTFFLRKGKNEEYCSMVCSRLYNIILTKKTRIVHYKGEIVDYYQCPPISKILCWVEIKVYETWRGNCS